MNIDKLILDLERDEGYREFPYKDSLGNWTIGIGHYLPGLTRQEALNLCRQDVVKACQDLYPLSWFVALNDARQNAIANMVFNLGFPRFSLFKNMIEALKNNDFELAAHEALNSQWAKQVGDRAKRIADLLIQGTYKENE